MNLDEMMDKIKDASCYLVQLNTLINEKWYDKQDQFIKCIESVKYDLRIIETIVKQEETRNDMIKILRNVCKVFSGCENCPLNKFRKLKCPVNDYTTLTRLNYKEVTEMYNSIEDWIKNFIL